LSELHNNGKTENVKIYDVSPVSEPHHFDIGKIIIEDSKIKVAVRDGYIIVNKLQLPGKKTMEAKALLNGYNFFRDARML